MYFAPRGPNDSDPPDLLRLSVSPGAIFILRQNRKYPIVAIPSAGRSIEQPNIFAVESRPAKRNAIQQINVNPATHAIQYGQHGEDCVLL